MSVVQQRQLSAFYCNPLHYSAGHDVATLQGSHTGSDNHTRGPGRQLSDLPRTHPRKNGKGKAGMASHEPTTEHEQRHKSPGEQSAIHRHDPHHLHVGQRTLHHAPQQQARRTHEKTGVPLPTQDHRRIPRQRASKDPAIAAVEPLDTKLKDLSVQWAARAVKLGNPHITQCLTEPPTPPQTA